MKNQSIKKTSKNLFNDMGFSPERAKILKLKTHIMIILIKYIQTHNLTQTEAAEFFDVTQPRISNLMHGKIDLFSIDMLLVMLTKSGFDICKKIDGLLDVA
jgi:predicted XRE-type DNA-binding protein